MDDYTFFYEASRRICSSLKIEKALWNCYRFIKDFVPVDGLTLHLFDPGLGFMETVADGAAAGDGEVYPFKTRLPSAVRDEIQSFIVGLEGKPKCQIVDRLDRDEMAKVVAEDLAASDLPALILDLIIEGDYLGILVVTNGWREKYTEEHARKIFLLHDPFAMACANYLRYRDLQELKDRLADNYRSLQDDLIHLKGDQVVGAEQGLKGVMEMVRQVAPGDTPVLLLGETGTGKEIIAQAIHRLSRRREEPLIKMDCAAVAESLMESDLFGHEKGAFTGAISRVRGRLERAHGGTLFLDEIGELSLQTQKKILRVLQDGVLERIGGSETISVDIRFIAATHRPLQAMVETGEFRKDLFFRLNVFPIEIPPLRERQEDIPHFVDHFIKKRSRKMRLPSIARLAPGVIDRLTAYEWPGNVRELENLVERELIVRGERPLTFSSLLPAGFQGIEEPVEDLESGALSLDRAMSSHIKKVLDMTGGRVEGKQGAARLLDIHPRTLQHRMKKLGIPFGRKYKKRQVR